LSQFGPPDHGDDYPTYYGRPFVQMKGAAGLSFLAALRVAGAPLAFH